MRASKTLYELVSIPPKPDDFKNITIQNTNKANEIGLKCKYSIWHGSKSAFEKSRFVFELIMGEANPEKVRLKGDARNVIECAVSEP